MPGHDLIVVGASAGGVEALTQLAHGLPADLPAAVCVVLHVPPHATSALPNILSRAGPLPVAHATDNEPLRNGRIYIAPPDHHLLIKPGHLRLARGPRENGHRPAVDPLFRTAARWYGPQVVGVVLSGALDDGTAGLAAVKARGGVAVVQDPHDALYDGMPSNALAHVAVDHILPMRDLSALLTRLAADPAGPAPPPPSPKMEQEAEMAELEPEALARPERPGEPAGFGCPDCGGALFELRDGELVRYRCRVGHAWSSDSLMAEQSEALETALWTALRALEERVTLARALLHRAEGRGQKRTAENFRRQVEDAEANARVIRAVLLRQEAPPPGVALENQQPPPKPPHGP